MYRLHKQEIVPVSFPIPYDVLCAIIEHVDFETLKMIALVSRDHHHEAGKRLWKTLSIQVRNSRNRRWTPQDSRLHLQTAASIISREDHARHIRDLRLGLDGSLGTREEAEAVIRVLFSSLQLATDLSSITLDVFGRHCRLIIDSFRIYGVAPRLCHVILGTSMGLAILKDPIFWRSRPTITSLQWLHYGRGFHLSPKSRPLSLPRLETICVGCVEHAKILRNCPVTNLTVKGVEEGECGILLENIRSSTADLLHLRIQRCWAPDIFPSVIRQLPQLQSLRVTHSGIELNDGELLDVLASLKGLELLELAGKRSGQFFERFMVSARRFRALQKVELRGRVPQASRIYRRDDDGNWTINSPQFSVL